MTAHEPLGQRQPRIKCPAFLAFVRRRPCCVCHAPPPSQAAHIKMPSLAHGKRHSGIGEKPSDRWCVSLCADCHLNGPGAQHQIGEVAFWKKAGIDPFETSIKLWAEFVRENNIKPMIEPGIECEFVLEGYEYRRVSPETDPDLYVPGRLRKWRPPKKKRETKSRPIQNANRWPPKGSRPLRSRPWTAPLPKP